MGCYIHHIYDAMMAGKVNFILTLGKQKIICHEKILYSYSFVPGFRTFTLGPEGQYQIYRFA